MLDRPDSGPQDLAEFEILGGMTGKTYSAPARLIASKKVSFLLLESMYNGFFSQKEDQYPSL